METSACHGMAVQLLFNGTRFIDDYYRQVARLTAGKVASIDQLCRYEE
jgi:hypothetical protein